MCHQPTSIEKSVIIETIGFVAKRIAVSDFITLECLLELVVVGGTHGSLTPDQLLSKMRHVLTYIPDTCSRTLLILVDVLGLEIDEALLTEGAFSQAATGYSIELPLLAEIDTVKGATGDFTLKVN